MKNCTNSKLMDRAENRVLVLRAFVLGLLFFCLTSTFDVAAQQSLPLLQGPIVVTNTPSQDGFLLIDLATGEQRRLSFGSGNHYMGGFSPDGCEIVFTWEQRPGYGDLYAAHIDGSHVRRLLDLGPTGALSYRAWEPEWSPDGSKIAFTLLRYYDPPDQEPYRTSHIAWVTPQGGRPEFYSSSGMESQPRWSSDGRRLVYVSNQPVIVETPEAENASGEEIEGKPELWVVSADSQNKFRLTSFVSNAAYNPRWSPTDYYIAFVYQTMPNFHQLMVMPSDGSASPIVVNQRAGTILDFVWQPTGDALIAAIQNYEGESRNTLWRLPLPAGTINSAVSAQLIDDPASLYHDYPRYSADGRWVAFRAAYELQVYDTVLGELHTFGADTLNNNPPVWSPTGFLGEAACPRD